MNNEANSPELVTITSYSPSTSAIIIVLLNSQLYFSFPDCIAVKTTLNAVAFDKASNFLIR